MPERRESKRERERGFGEIMMQSGGEGGGGAAPLPPSTSGPNATDRVKEQVENVTARATEAVQGAFTHPWLPVVFRGWVCLFSFLAWTITASCGSIGTDPVNFQLAAALCTWFFSLFWLLVEVFQVLDKPLCFPPGSKIVLSFEIYSDAAMAFLCFGAACSVAGLTSTTCTNSIWGSLANA